MPSDILNAAAAAAAFAELQEHGGVLTRPQLAEQWGVTRQVVEQLSRRPGFPPRWITAGRSQLYLYAEVLAWRRSELERPGRPGPAAANTSEILAAPQYDVDAAKSAAARVLAHGGLAGAHALARRYDTTRQTIQNHAGEYGFPAKRLEVPDPLYLVADVDAWRRGRGLIVPSVGADT